MRRVGLGVRDECWSSPSEHGRWAGRLTVLTEASTYGASEDFLLGLQGLEHVTVLGEVTGTAVAGLERSRSRRPQACGSAPRSPTTVPENRSSTGGFTQIAALPSRWQISDPPRSTEHAPGHFKDHTLAHDPRTSAAGLLESLALDADAGV